MLVKDCVVKMNLALLLVAVTAVVCVPLEQLETEKPVIRLFKTHGVFLYKYNATIHVSNPNYITNERPIPINILADTRIHIGDEVVELKVTDFKLFYHLNDDSELRLVEEIEQHLKRPIYFHYVEGLVRELRHDDVEPEYILNLKKGLISMLSVDYLGKDLLTGDNTMFTKIEQTIHGLCETTYVVEKYEVPSTTELEYLNITKTINANNCSYLLTEEWNTVSEEQVPVNDERTAENKDARVTKALTTVHFRLVRSRNNFKLMDVNSTGVVSFQPFSDKPNDVIVAISHQSLKLIEESSSLDNLPTTDRMSKAHMMMRVPMFHSFTKQSLKHLQNRQRIVDIVVEELKHLAEHTKDTDAPLPVHITHRISSLVNMLRESDVHTLELLHTTCVSQEDSVIDWYMRVISLVKTEDSLRVVVRKVEEMEEDKESRMKMMLKEYIEMIAFTGHVTDEMMSMVKDLCMSRIVKESVTLYEACLSTGANMVRKHCNTHPTCNVEFVDILKNRLVELTQSHVVDKLELQNITYYLILVEATQHQSLWPVLRKLINDVELPIKIRARAVLACRPLVKKLKNKIVLPLMRMLKDVSLYEEIRLASITCLVKVPTPSLLTAFAHHLKFEPSLTIKRYIFEIIINVARVPEIYPTSLRDVARVCISHIVSQRLLPLEHRWFSHYMTKILKPLPTESVSAILHNKVFFTRNTTVPRFIQTKFNLTMFGRNIDVLDFEMRLEGIQELITRLSHAGPLQKSEEFEQTLVRASRKYKTIKKLEEMRVDVRTYDEEANVLANLKLFGNNFLTKFLNISLLEDLQLLMSGDMLEKMQTIEKRLKEGYDHKYVQPMMPVEVIYRLPSSVGIPVVFNLTTVMLNRLHTSIKASTSPNMFSMRMLRERKLDTVDMNMKLKHSTAMSILGSISYQTPMFTCGHSIRKDVNVSLNTGVVLNINMQDNDYKMEFEAPERDEDIFQTENNWEHTLTVNRDVVYSLESACPFTRCTPSVPVAYKIPIYLVHENGRHISRNDYDTKTLAKVMVFLKTGNKKYLSARNGKLVISTLPYKWILRQYGDDSERLITLYAPAVGHLSVDANKNRFSFVKNPKPFLIRWLKPSHFLLYTMLNIPDSENIYTKTIMPYIDQYMPHISTEDYSVKTWEHRHHGDFDLLHPEPHWSHFLNTPRYTAIKKLLCNLVSTRGSRPTTSRTPCRHSENPFNKLRRPVYPEQVYKLNIINGKFNDAFTNATVYVAVEQGKYLSLNHGNVGLSSTPFEWTLIYHGNSRLIVSLYALGEGYLNILPETNSFTIASEPKLFMLKYVTPKSFSLRTVVRATDEDKDSEEHVEDLLEYIKAFQNQEVKLPESEEMYNVMLYKSAKNYVIRYVSVRGNTCVLTRTPAAFFFDKVRHVSETLRNEYMQHGYCVGKNVGIQLCWAGYVPSWSKDTIFRTFMAPMTHKVFTKRDESNAPTKLVIRCHKDTSLSSDDRKVYKQEVTLTGIRPEKRIDMTTESIKSSRTFRFDMKSKPSDIELLGFRRMCMTYNHAEDNITVETSFDEECNVPHIKVHIETEKSLPRYYLAAVWKVSYDGLPNSVQRTARAIKSNIVLPLLRSPWILFTKPVLLESIRERKNSGRWSVTLRDDRFVDVHLELDTEKIIYRDVQLPVAIKSFPYGTHHFPLTRKLWYVTEPTCWHQGSRFATFDGVEYEYDLPKLGCQHILLQNCSSNITRFAVMVKRVTEMQKAIYIVINNTFIEIDPKTGNKFAIPVMKIDGEIINSRMTNNKYKYIKAGAPKIKVFWENELQQLVFYNYELGLEFTLFNGITIRTRINSNLFSKTCGLCGNRDSETSKEFQIPAGKTVSDSKLFAASWILPSLNCNGACPFELRYVEATSGQKLRSEVPIPKCKPGCSPAKTMEVTVPFTTSSMLATATSSKILAVPTKCHCKTCETETEIDIN